MSRSLLFRYRQPEYTGENRCLPCTGTNVVITGGISLAVGYGWTIVVGRFAWLIASTVLAVGLVTVWLRGYLVPGTPELTKRYLPDWFLELFDKGAGVGPTPDGIDSPGDETTTPDDGSDASEDGPHPEDVNVDDILLTAGVVAPCEHQDDLCLDDGFRTGWYDRMQSIPDEATEREDLARELDENPEDIEFEDHDGAFVARNDDRRLGQWESRAALVADLAAARELPEWVEDWDTMAVAVRSQLLSGLRIFLDTCPDCEGPVVTGTETIESCCSSRDILAANCEDCDTRLLEIQYPEPA